ncbi:MAG: hypothetical protein JWM82_4022 [Myxococcales bacterium]|nr:hypothetical protein [Myxococcales bacterium]
MRATVIDMNCVRREDRVIPIMEEAARDQIPILLPEALLYEGVKGRDWEEGLRVTLEHVARFPNRVVAMARRVHHLVEFESRTGSVIADFAYREQQPRLVGILEDIRCGTRATFDQIRQENPGAPDAMPRDNDESARTLLLAEIARVQRLLPAELLNRLRRFPDDDLPASFLAERDRTSEFQSFLQKRGYDPKVSESLALLPSVTAHEYFAIWALTLWWISHGGAAAAKAKTFANDLRDLEYVTLGLGCSSFVTDDGRLASLYRQLSMTARLRWTRSTVELGKTFPDTPPIGIYRTMDHIVD